ncbi:GNAT family N-acetyltransferase [Formosa maritima]|uniref:GNAT family N-acetyltransferase n=1 Tax=Formosa maritima TaxID=2592046 RepID=A0A5D0G3I5_9FLAO|nr:GNAT family N-acetyltransferase [Formosa maritima]TYA53210.1 GNAT family N-acetyltransferase [Formosa maritima]
MSQIKFISAKETYVVRHPVLREGRPIEDCAFDSDEDENTFHLGLYFDSKLVGVASYIKNNSKLFLEKNQYQLRGMAVLKEYQKKGFGDLLLNEGEKILNQKKVDILWFNAREIAFNFYKKNNYQAIGDAFNIPEVGLHYVMFKNFS